MCQNLILVLLMQRIDSGNQLDYRNFKETYFDPIMKDIGMSYTIKHCRATFRRLMVQSGVNPFMIKKIMGTKQGMTLTEKVYIGQQTKLFLLCQSKFYKMSMQKYERQKKEL